MKSVNEVEDVPQGFKDWVADNKERIEAAEKRGTIPYFICDNRSAVNAVLKPEEAETAKTKTEESKAKTGNEERRARNRALYDRLKDNPDYIEVDYHEKSGGVKGTHVGHNLDPKKGWYEIPYRMWGTERAIRLFLRMSHRTKKESRAVRGYGMK